MGACVCVCVCVCTCVRVCVWCSVPWEVHGCCGVVVVVVTVYNSVRVTLLNSLMALASAYFLYMSGESVECFCFVSHSSFVSCLLMYILRERIFSILKIIRL